jgi:SAM-dependent methyltransferase
MSVFFVIFKHMSNWQRHYQDTKNKPVSKLLLEALPLVANEKRALDLGAGALVDSKYLLSVGFEVVAVDREKFADQIDNEKFSFVQSSYDDYEFPEASFDLISAQYSLPFNGPVDFEKLWQGIIRSLRLGGIFVGQLFGLNDEWNVVGSKLVFHSRGQVEALLSGLEILKLEDVERDGKLANGQSKRWHLFNIIVRKNY